LLDYLFFYNYVFPGIFLGGKPIGFMSREDLKDYLGNLSASLDFVDLKLVGNEKEIKVQIKQNLYLLPYIDCIYFLGRTSNPIENYKFRNEILIKPYIIKIYDYDYIKKVIHELLPYLYSFERNSSDAKFQVKNNSISILPSNNGIKVDIDDLEKLLHEKFNELSPLITINLPLIEILPNVTTQTLESYNINRSLYSFTTQFNPNNKERSKNIELASKSFNHLLVFPGQIISFNDITGPRTKEKGYQPAPIFVGDLIIDEIGGGICQVSSTLYNLLLLADLKIVSRYNHSRPVNYVPKGRDATVSFGHLDLKFINNHNQIYLLYSELYYDALTLKLFGNKANDYTVEIITETIKIVTNETEHILDTSLPKGSQRVEEGNNGYMITVWKIKNKNGTSISKTIVSKDIYRPINTKIYYNPK
jgi:vancomycin resistance protein YoaR